MAFSHVQGGGISQATLVSSVVVTLGSNPAQGNVVIVGVLQDSGNGTITGQTVKDSNNNNYTQSPASPISHGNGAIASIYYLIAPSNATKTITVAWTGANNTPDVWADEFSAGGSTILFDKDLSGSNTFAGTTVNLPTITVTGVNELVYAIGFPGNALTAPTGGATLGIWTGTTLGVNTTNTGGGTEYLLSGSGSLAPNFTDSAAGDTVQVILAAFFTQPFEDDSFVQFQPPPFDPIVSVW